LGQLKGRAVSELVCELEASFDRNGRAAVAYLRVRNGQWAETRQLVDGSVNAKYDRDGKLLGVELYGRCELQALAGLAAEEPEEVRRFLLGAVPRDFIQTSPPVSTTTAGFSDAALL
jgi:uncharacterized protein YuzE